MPERGQFRAAFHGAGIAIVMLDDELMVGNAVARTLSGAFTPYAQAFLGRVPNPRLEKPFEASVLRGLVRQILAAPR